MSDIVLRVENLSKQYRIGARQERHDTLRDQLMCGIKSLFQRNGKQPSFAGQHPASSPQQSEGSIWALKDVSFEIKEGEVLGVIGRNGAGKSTLLKIMSRITEPTYGRIEIDGRVASLLEVGTGFHPELTGRENIYFNGTILGMKRVEIARKFDEIVAFAEIEKFLDTPVKRYSSGMYVRLAFGVAAHLEPDILIVDEVLAVGDAAFQKKCLRKMHAVARGGRTVLFVSHNLTAITSLCEHAILLEGGMLTQMGPVSSVIPAYLSSIGSQMVRGERSFEQCPSLPFSITNVRTFNESGVVTSVVDRSSAIVICVRGEVHDNSLDEDYHIAIDVRTVEGTLLFRTHSFEQPESYEIIRQKGPFTLECILPANLLPTGTYRLAISSAVSGKRELQNWDPALELDVLQGELLGNRFLGTRGLLTPHCDWRRTPLCREVDSAPCA